MTEENAMQRAADLLKLPANPARLRILDELRRSEACLPAKNCRRSRNVIEYLEAHGSPFTRIEFESAEGRALAEEHQMRASPGILVDGAGVNPFEALLQVECHMDEDAAHRQFMEDRTR